MKLPRPKFKTPDEIKAFRKKLGERQDVFWGRVGITQSGGSRYESGRNIPSPVQILMTITYGTPSESQRMIEALRAWKQ